MASLNGEIPLKREFLGKGLLGAVFAVLFTSSCSDPTSSEVYNNLESEYTKLETSIVELEVELKSLEEDLERATQLSKDASASREDLELQRDGLESEIDDLGTKNSIKERNIQSSRRDLTDVKNELAELIEEFG